jgi:hypothetical protein
MNDVWRNEMAAMNKTRFAANQVGHVTKPPERESKPVPRKYLGIETSKDFLARFRPAEYTVDGVLQTGMTYALTGYTGHGKSSAALFLCLCILLGKDFGGHEVVPGAVLFLAGENPDNVMAQWHALCDYHNVDPVQPNMHWHYGYFDIKTSVAELREEAEKVPNLRLIVADTLQAFFAGESNNDNVQMMESARGFRSLGRIDTKPTILIPAHPAGKKPDRTMLVPRGGGAFLNEIDGNFTIWNDDEGTLNWSWHGKLRGAPFDPFALRLDLYSTCGAIADRQGRIPSISVVDNINAVELGAKLHKATETDVRILEHLRMHPKLTQMERAENSRGEPSDYQQTHQYPAG